MKIFADPKTLFKRKPWFIVTWHMIRSWFKYTFNKEHLALIKEAYTGRPYDYAFLYGLERKKIEEMVRYHERQQMFVGVEYTIRDMKICLSILEILMGERDTFHYTGNLVFKDTDEDKDMKEVGTTPDFKYHCDVYVNTKNLKRFVQDEKLYDFYTGHPHELYELKAKALYHKIRYERDWEWWD